MFPRKGKLSQTARPFKAMVDDDLSSRVHDAAREKGTAVHALLLSVYSPADMEIYRQHVIHYRDAAGRTGRPEIHGDDR